MWIEHLATLALFPALAALAWIDFRTFRLPDRLTLPLIALGVWSNTIFLGTPLAAMAGAAIGYGVLFAVEKFYLRVRGRAGLGRGDAKLLAAAGAWCGAVFLPFVLMIGSISALLYVALLALVQRKMPDDSTAIAFGPWLALGFLICWVIRAYGPAAYGLV